MNIHEKLLEVPNHPYGWFSDEDKLVLAEAEKILCGDDKEKIKLLENIVRSHIRCVYNDAAFDAAGESQ